MAKSENVLTEEFLAELYNAAITDNGLCSVVAMHMKDEYLPDKDYQALNNAIKSHFLKHKTCPKYSIIKQIMSNSRAVTELISEIKDLSSGAGLVSIREQFEMYLKFVMFKQAQKKIADYIKAGDQMAAMNEQIRSSEQIKKFSLAPDEFEDVAKTLQGRLIDNKARQESESKMKLVNSFYIDALDEMNRGRNLRTQLTVFLAMSGVGKSHLARYIGYNAAYISGLDVLHFQMEGSKSEVMDAYSAQILNVPTLQFEHGEVNQHTMDSFTQQLEQYAGTLKVKTYSKFGKEVSTTDLRNDCEKYKEEYGKYPDVIIVDSLDLLNDSSGRNWDGKSLRFKRIAVAEDLKDLAGDLNAWVLATYQATIENQEWVNDEKNVLNGYNLSEAKGLQRPLTHLITMNQSSREEREQMMRLYVAKSRFFKRGEPIRICTDYEHERFYDRVRTMNLPPAA